MCLYSPLIVAVGNTFGITCTTRRKSHCHMSHASPLYTLLVISFMQRGSAVLEVATPQSSSHYPSA